MKDEGDAYLTGRSINEATVTKMVRYFTGLDKKDNRTEWRMRNG